MAQITLNIPNQYVPRLLEAIVSTWPIPQIENPDYESNPLNPSTYDYSTPQFINQYTEVAWAKMKIINFLSDTLERYETKRDMRAAKKAVNIPSDLVD